MTLTTLLKSVLAFVVLVVAAGICPGDPPILVDPNDVACLAAPQCFPVDPWPAPRVADYSRSGCLDDPNDPWFPPCGGDENELVVEGKFGEMASLRGIDMVSVPIAEAVGKMKTVDKSRIEEMKMFFGH